MNLKTLRSSIRWTRSLVGRGRWAAIMPVSVFRDNAPDAAIVMSGISGVQLKRLLVLATRIDPRLNYRRPDSGFWWITSRPWCGLPWRQAAARLKSRAWNGTGWIWTERPPS